MRPSLRAASATALAALALAPAAQADTPRARPADAFVDSIGVNVHLGYTDTPYRRYDEIQKKLIRLGVRHVRDGINPGQAFVYEAWRSLASCGIKLDLIIGDPLQRHGIGPLESQLDLVKQARLQGALASIEGPNEYDIQGDPNWRPRLRDYQQRLYREVKSDPALRRIPVLGPSLVQGESRGQLGDLSGSLDFGNIHPYPSGNEPDLDSHMDQELGMAATNSGRKPVQATETGYHNAVDSSNPHRPATERAAGTYMPRLFLDYFRRGIARTYSYELLDEFPDGDKTQLEANFGLLRNDFSEKPAYTAIRHLTELLRDPGPRFKTGALPYSLAGTPNDLRQVLLEKRDGSFYLALWREDSVWDQNAGRKMATSADALRLSLPRGAKRVEVYRPSSNSGPVLKRANVRSVGLDVSPSVQIVKIVPSGRRPTALSHLKGQERRVAASFLRLRKVRPASLHVQHHQGRLGRWLTKRARSLRRNGRRHGWHKRNRLVRYRAIHAVLRRA